MLGLKRGDLQVVWRRVVASAGSKPITATIVKAAVADYKHQTYSRFERAQHESIPEEVISAIHTAERLFFKLKSCARRGDRNKIKMLLDELRHVLLC
jgi:hypothetical protein